MLLIKTQRDVLLTPLQSVSGIVEKRHTLPILSNVLLEKKADVLTFLATDIEIQITTSTTGAIGDGDGSVTVQRSRLSRASSLAQTRQMNLVDRRLRQSVMTRFLFARGQTQSSTT